MDFPSHGSQLSLALLLFKSVNMVGRHVSYHRLKFGFHHLRLKLIFPEFYWEFFQLPFWASGTKWRKNFDRTYLSHSPQIPHYCQLIVYLFGFRSN